MNLFFEDLAKGRISITDERAFEVGTQRRASTPGAVIFENELMQLIQYAPPTDEVHERPLLIVPPCINKFYILDLQPENSFVRYACEQGHTVFLVSWRNVGRGAGPPDLGRLPRAGRDAGDRRRARRSRGADKVNTLGFCVGGTLLASALAVLRARDDEDKVASMTLLTTMLDFSEPARSARSSTSRAWRSAKRRSARAASCRARSSRFAFSSLRANDLIWPYVVNNYLKGKAPPAFDLLYWNADSTNLPGPMYCWYVRNTYLENNLRVPGKTIQCGEPVDLSRSTCRPSSTPRAKTTSCRGTRRTHRTSCSRARRRSCSAPAATSPA